MHIMQKNVMCYDRKDSDRRKKIIYIKFNIKRTFIFQSFFIWNAPFRYARRALTTLNDKYEQSNIHKVLLCQYNGICISVIIKLINKQNMQYYENKFWTQFKLMTMF